MNPVAPVTRITRSILRPPCCTLARKGLRHGSEGHRIACGGRCARRGVRARSERAGRRCSHGARVPRPPGEHRHGLRGRLPGELRGGKRGHLDPCAGDDRARDRAGRPERLPLPDREPGHQRGPRVRVAVACRKVLAAGTESRFSLKLKPLTTAYLTVPARKAASTSLACPPGTVPVGGGVDLDPRRGKTVEAYRAGPGVSVRRQTATL